jgi:hypothetical protein
LHRDILTEKLVRIIKTIENQTDLPLDPIEIYVFGSYAHGSKNPGDLDLIIVHEKLTRAQEQAQMEALEGHGTTLEQKMRSRLKGKAEKIDILLGESLGAATQRQSLGYHLKVWSKTDRNWLQKIEKLQALKPEDRVVILEEEAKNLRHSVRVLRENILAFQIARNATLQGGLYHRFEEARSKAVDRVRAEDMEKRARLETL